MELLIDSGTYIKQDPSEKRRKSCERSRETEKQQKERIEESTIATHSLGEAYLKGCPWIEITVVRPTCLFIKRQILLFDPL